MNQMDAALSGIVSRSQAQVREAPDDYRENGILVCGKCHTPKQYRLTLGGKSVLAGCMCRCENAAYEREREEQRKRQRLLEIKQLRVQGIQDTELRKRTFSASERSKNMDGCWNYTQNWERMRESNAGLLLWGGVDTGKTHAAACMANALIDRGIPVLMTSFPKILNAGWDKSELIRQICQFELMVIDDLGAERESAYSLEVVYTVVDERYKSGKPLIVTTNLRLEELRDPQDIDRSRIYSRILEMCVPICFDGPSHRTEQARKKFQLIGELFR